MAAQKMVAAGASVPAVFVQMQRPAPTHELALILMVRG
jgi:hypothetical protein